MSASERVVVGRKTPGDGKLEVSPGLAMSLGGHGSVLDVRLQGRALSGRVSAMECTCTKASAAGKHEHQFVECDAFRDLAAGAELQLSADGTTLTVALG
ncbi:MAG: hypothetical protein ACT4P6_06630 [Gemmatimonadaceae bacterium]